MLAATRTSADGRGTVSTTLSTEPLILHLFVLTRAVACAFAADFWNVVRFDNHARTRTAPAVHATQLTRVPLFVYAQDPEQSPE